MTPYRISKGRFGSLDLWLGSPFLPCIWILQYFPTSTFGFPSFLSYLRYVLVNVASRVTGSSNDLVQPFIWQMKKLITRAVYWLLHVWTHLPAAGPRLYSPHASAAVSQVLFSTVSGLEMWNILSFSHSINLFHIFILFLFLWVSQHFSFYTFYLHTIV